MVERERVLMRGKGVSGRVFGWVRVPGWVADGMWQLIPTVLLTPNRADIG